MGELANYTIDQVAGALALTLGSLGGLCLILFKSRCTEISICWGLWSCDRKVSEEDKEDVDKKDDKKDESILPTPTPTPTPTPLATSSVPQLSINNP
jgi:hypothetical protein